MKGRVGLVGAVGVLAFGAWTLMASALFLFVCGLWGQIASPVTRLAAWWFYAFSPYAANPSIKLTLALSAVAPAIVLIAPIALFRAASARRQAGLDLYGKTGWATPTEMRQGGVKLDRRR